MLKLHESFPDDPAFNPGHVEIGIGNIDFEPWGSPKYWEARVLFKCCTGCHQPFNLAEATRLNEMIGLELPSTESLKDRMAILRANKKARGESK